MKIELLPTAKLRVNPDNPRVIRDERFAKLVQSIREFPKMLEIRPIVVNAEMMVLGGNMRLRACQEAGLKKVPVIRADELTEDEQRRFIIADNVAFGEHDWDTLANWDAEELTEWGLGIPDFTNYSDKNKEVDVEGMESEMAIFLKYTPDQYWKVKEQLAELAEKPEQAVWILLGNDKTPLSI